MGWSSRPGGPDGSVNALAVSGRWVAVWSAAALRHRSRLGRQVKAAGGGTEPGGTVLTGDQADLRALARHASGVTSKRSEPSASPTAGTPPEEYRASHSPRSCYGGRLRGLTLQVLVNLRYGDRPFPHGR